MRAFRLCLAFFLALLLLAWTAPADAAAPESIQSQNQIIHVVQPGENLFRISLRYGSSVDAIMTANGLTGTTIYTGQRLIIPGSSSSSVPPGSTVQPGGTYTIQPGDNLSRIAVRHGVTVGALMQVNRLTNSTVYVGQRLVIPGGGVPVAAPAVAASDTYIVQPGDNLIKIAQRYGTTSASLAQLNGIINPSAIYPGQVLRLSSTAPVASSGGGKRIVVDLSEQHLYAYEGDRLVYSFVASSGAAPSYTRVGEFRVQSKIPNAYGAAWNIWMPNWLGIYWAGSTENGIHALPILSNGATLWAGYLGRPVSYGCVVLGTQEAQMLYNWAEIGTPVSIRY